MINIERQTPAEQLIANTREVPMLHNENVRPYEEAEITLEEIDMDDSKPTTLHDQAVSDIKRLLNLGGSKE